MSAENDNAGSCIKFLWQEGYFRDPHNLKDVSTRITEKWGHNFSASDVSKALKKAGFLISSGKRGSFQYKQKISPNSVGSDTIKAQLFSADLIIKLGTSFKNEIRDLQLNFDRSGTCSAFLLRKILEKAIYLAFAKNGIAAKLDDGSGTGRLVGLEAMIDVSAREKIKGIPILVSKTAEKIKGIKFLGDTSAHNPLINVDMETILPQIPFIITAYKELAERL